MKNKNKNHTTSLNNQIKVHVCVCEFYQAKKNFKCLYGMTKV